MTSDLQHSSARRLPRLLAARPVTVNQDGDLAGFPFALPLVEKSDLPGPLQESHDLLDLREVPRLRLGHVLADLLRRELHQRVVLGHVVQPGRQAPECLALLNRSFLLFLLSVFLHRFL